MAKHKSVILIGILCMGISLSFLNLQTIDSKTELYPEENPVGSITNYDLIESVMNSKLNQFTTQGYFDQAYVPSIQATYYALTTLEKLGKLTEVSFSEVASFIMSYYNTSTKLFMDEYTKRYLDTNYSIYAFPLNSLLLTNCYAVLSLNTIGYLNQIDTNEMKSFIWNCYNPETSGFIGRPYSIGLPSEWRISTMDNTYYAVITYDLLNNKDWSTKTTQKNAIIDFIESLQDSLRGGGFHNDPDPNWYSLDLAEPNIYASYFCIKTLMLFNWIPAIDIPAFHKYLSSLYHAQDCYFESVINPFFINKTNVVSSALGLALCHLTGNETFVNKAEVINFIRSCRNPEGGFYRSSSSTSYELLDHYQIICGLADAEELNSLSIENKQEIANFLTLYIQRNGGYAPISRNYMGISLLHSVIGSFVLFERETELPIQDLYSLILANFREFGDDYGFSSCDPSSTFRVQPIDYVCLGTRQLLPEILLSQSHYSTYLSLITLQHLRKVNDFAATRNLQFFIDTVIQSQFLDANYPQNFGAFSYFYNNFEPSVQNELILMKYSYYAVKVMELIAEELGSTPISSLGFDVDALDTYILRNLFTSSTKQYVTDGILTSPEDLLEQTYYSAYILKAINRNSLNVSKVKNFVENNINYSNIKNIYYSFVLSELLNLDLEFDINAIHSLIQGIYSSDDNEFYLTPQKQEVCQEAMFYIAEMAKTDTIRILPTHPSEVSLGGYVTMTVELANLVLRDFGPYITVKLESDQVGTYIMELQEDLSFTKSFQIQAIATNFPSVSGDIAVYEGSSKITSQPFEVFTTYNTITTISSSQTPTKILFTLNASVFFASGTQAILDGDAYIHSYKNNLYIDTKHFNQQGFARHTTFMLEYYPSAEGTYHIEVYLKDGINVTARKIAEYNYTCTDPDSTGGYRADVQEAFPLVFILLAAPGILLVISYKDRLLKRESSVKPKFTSKLANLLKKSKSK